MGATRVPPLRVPAALFSFFFLASSSSHLVFLDKIDISIRTFPWKSREGEKKEEKGRKKKKKRRREEEKKACAPGDAAMEVEVGVELDSEIKKNAETLVSDVTHTIHTHNNNNLQHE